FTSLEFADYPTAYTDKAQVQRLAKIRLEEQDAARRTVTMSSLIRNLVPGFKFTLQDHPAQALNIEYLVTELAHTATQEQVGEEESSEPGTKHDVEIWAIPATIPFRPERVTARPVVKGSQTALVVGPSGEEIYTDEYGRVKVQFHWDREGKFDENSSFWIRVSQGSAGGQYGMMFL